MPKNKKGVAPNAPEHKMPREFMTEKEVVEKLRKNGYEVTPEEVKSLKVLMSTNGGMLNDDDLANVAGGISPKFEKALIAIGVVSAAALATAGTVKGVAEYKRKHPKSMYYPIGEEPLVEPASQQNPKH